MNTYFAKTTELFANNTSDILAGLDYKTTKYSVLKSEKGDVKVFLTKSYKNSLLQGGLLSYVTPQQKVFHVQFKAYTSNNNDVINELITLNNQKFSEITIRGGKIIAQKTFHFGSTNNPELGIVNPSEEFELYRSWWSCTSDCIGDAHYACYGDSECTTLLIATNLAALGLPVRPGLGSLSISAACGVSCLMNKNMDLLPGY